MGEARPPGIDPAELEVCLRVLAAAETLAGPSIPTPSRSGGRRPALQDRQAAPPVRAACRGARRRRGGDRRDGHGRARSHRRRDPGPAARLHRPRARRRACCASARACYVCKGRYREVDAFYHQLCPACARAPPRAPRRAHRPHRPTRAAHGRAREDRDVHRSAAAARRRAHDDHDAVPARRGAALHRDATTAPTGCIGCASSASTCAIRLRSWRSRTRCASRGHWTS